MFVHPEPHKTHTIWYTPHTHSLWAIFATQHPMPSHLWIAATSRCASPELATERMAVPRARINAEGFAAAPVRFGGGDGSLDWSHAWSGRRISSLSRAHSTPDRPPLDASLVFCDLDSGAATIPRHRRRYRRHRHCRLPWSACWHLMSYK